MTTIAINSAADRVLLSGRIKFCTGVKLFGRVRLYYDRITVAGVTPNGRFERAIQLSEISSIDWWTGKTAGPNLALILEDEVFGFWVKGAGVWRFKIEELLAGKNKLSSKEDKLVSAA